MEGICSSGKTLGLHFRKILCEHGRIKRVRLEARRLEWVAISFSSA